MPTVLVTGASSGIGQSTAIELARRGTDVLLTYRGNPAGAQQTVAEVQAVGATGVALELDASRIDTFPAFVSDVSRILRDQFDTDTLDGLVNNAGLSYAAMFDQMGVPAFDQLVDTLFKGPYFLTQALLPLLADGGAIVNTTSSSTNPFDLSVGYSAYGSVKGAVVVWTRYLAKELSTRRIRVNSVSPGPTRTRLGDDGFAKYPELIAPLADRTALGRIGEGVDVGKVIAFLLSDDSGWITAQDIEASGGFNL
jgi:NAD(P)-dependent dehydrogenase (short-subunit alcohol dehydrogenase family)